MKRQADSILTTITSQGWGDRAASQLDATWRGHVRQVAADSVLLVGAEGGAIRLVTQEIGDGPLYVVVNQNAAATWRSLPLGLYAWRSEHNLHLGDHVTVRLPERPPWESTLSWWRKDCPLGDALLARRLALLSDWLMARAPEDTLAAVLPDLLTSGSTAEKANQRADLPPQVRLFHWRAGSIFDLLWPALASGDMAIAESAVKLLTELDQRSPSSGDSFMLGWIAGTQLWSKFLTEGCGLRAKSLLLRLTRTVAERTGQLGQALLLNALQDRWGAHWHDLYAALSAQRTANGSSDLNSLQNQLFAVAHAWLAQDPVAASAALAGFVMPFLWYQRFML